MSILQTVYQDTVISVALWAEDKEHAEKLLYRLALRYLKPQPVRYKDGATRQTTNVMGGETDWFILPASYSYSIAKTLIEQKVSGLEGFDEDGFSLMINWLIEMEEIRDCMSY